MLAKVDKVTVNNKLEYAEDYILEADIKDIDIEEACGYAITWLHSFVAFDRCDGETKPDANPKTVIDLSDEPEARRRHVKTIASKEAETQRDQESGNGDGKDKQVVKPIVEAGLGKKVADEGLTEKEEVAGLGIVQDVPKEKPVGGTSLDSSSKPTGDGTRGGTYWADMVGLYEGMKDGYEYGKAGMELE
ncbi:hypothetical protein L1987_02067 [Smallanthus sonchifolius]|uniref:Uncharacterized protein n=1 Tax=Smallanthus sonchifolius TaxID=185202 RepID=A0ACB9K6Y1_9ASTR|nr:hypothetical protein L1987_02067 [Smallanthus sonchifolius]